VGDLRRTPIVAISASSDGMADPRLVQAGIDDALPKPFSLPALQACLARWLANTAPSRWVHVESPAPRSS
jgi:CheY-like chemotaxis protein